MKNLAALIAAVLYGGHSAQAYYLPGVAPKSFESGETVELKVNALTSTQDPFAIEYYHLPFCRPAGGIVVANENLGELLSGDRIESSPYKIQMKTDMYCEQVCSTNLGRSKPIKHWKGKKKSKKDDPNRVAKSINRSYHNNWIVDNLPAASRVTYGEREEDTESRYWQGFPIGFVDPESNLEYIYNHVNIELQYHTVETESNKFRIVGFTVVPFSINHEFKNDLESDEDAPDTDTQTSIVATIVNPIQSCKKGETNLHTDYKMATVGGSQRAIGPVLFTYDVLWSENKDLHWGSRWDVYLKMNDSYPAKIHWFSIANSIIIVLLLFGLIAGILVRNLRRDVARYSNIPTAEEREERSEDVEEFGWKLVHADVFRAPKHPMVFAVFCGSGMQILLMSFFTIMFAWMGFLNPSNRGSLLIALLLLYVVMGSVAGYTTARMYKTFKGKCWQKATVYTAFGFPGMAFTIFIILNLFTMAQKSGDAVPFHTIFTLVILWFGISTPLVFLGAYIGYKKASIEFPVDTSSIPRQIPDQPWFMNKHIAFLAGGIMPFGSCFLELYFIMTSIWMHQYYYVFGILLMVFAILLLICAEIAILFNYFRLCYEDYDWWWVSFNSAGSVAIYVFCYSISYFKQLANNSVASYALYFGYMGLVSFMVFLMTGTVGFFSVLYFNKIIYGSIKID